MRLSAGRDWSPSAPTAGCCNIPPVMIHRCDCSPVPAFIPGSAGQQINHVSCRSALGNWWARWSSLRARDRIQLDQGVLQKLDALVIRQVGEVEHGARRYLKTSRPPVARSRQMDLRREDIREMMQRQGGLVAEHADALGPQPDDDEVFVVTGRKVH